MELYTYIHINGLKWIINEWIFQIELFNRLLKFFFKFIKFFIWLNFTAFP